MTNDLGLTYCMTFDLYMTFDLDTKFKHKFRYKSLYFIQIILTDKMSWSCDLSLVRSYGDPTDIGSKVTNGSISVFWLKTLKIHFRKSKHGKYF